MKTRLRLGSVDADVSIVLILLALAETLAALLIIAGGFVASLA